MKSGKTKVLLIDDDQSFSAGLAVGLQSEGYEVESFNNARQAVDAFEEVNPDIVLLDIVMPDMSGVDVCRWIRSTSEVPVIILSAKVDEIDTVIGLEVGADDYVAKPHRLRELVARMRAVLRRGRLNAKGESVDGGALLRVGSVELDPRSHRVERDGKAISLALKEFELLAYLLGNAGHAVTRTELVSHVWGTDYVGDTKTLDVHIKRLRAKLEDDPADPKIISTIRGLGYRLELPAIGAVEAP